MGRFSRECRVGLRGDVGFGLVEIIISMFLFTLLAAAFLPLLIDSLRATVRNATIATATQVMSEHLDSVTLVNETCTAFTQWALQTPSVVTDDRGSTYQAQRTVAGCLPASYPAAVTITIKVLIQPDSDIRVESTTFAVVEESG